MAEIKTYQKMEREQVIQIEICRHEGIESLTSFNKEKRVVLLNGEYVGKVNRDYGKQTWFAEIHGMRVKSGLKDRAAAVNVVVQGVIEKVVHTPPAQKREMPAYWIPEEHRQELGVKDPAVMVDVDAKGYDFEKGTVNAPLDDDSDPRLHPRDVEGGIEDFEYEGVGEQLAREITEAANAGR